MFDEMRGGRCNVRPNLLLDLVFRDIVKGLEEVRSGLELSGKVIGRTRLTEVLFEFAAVCSIACRFSKEPHQRTSQMTDLHLSSYLMFNKVQNQPSISLMYIASKALGSGKPIVTDGSKTY